MIDRNERRERWKKGEGNEWKNKRLSFSKSSVTIAFENFFFLIFLKFVNKKPLCGKVKERNT